MAALECEILKMKGDPSRVFPIADKRITVSPPPPPQDPRLQALPAGVLSGGGGLSGGPGPRTALLGACRGCLLPAAYFSPGP